jgi:hypothetical protein
VTCCMCVGLLVSAGWLAVCLPCSCWHVGWLLGGWWAVDDWQMVCDVCIE